MPLMTFCKHPGCRRSVPRGVDFCGQHKSDAEKHAAAARKAREARRTAFKGSSAKRGYGYRWQKLRNRFIAQHPFCEQCMKQGRLTIATDIDHIKPHRSFSLMRKTCKPSATLVTRERRLLRMEALGMRGRNDSAGNAAVHPIHGQSRPHGDGGMDRHARQWLYSFHRRA